MENTKITKDWTLSRVLKMEGATQILEKHKLPCLHCPLASVEMNDLTLEKITGMYDLNLSRILKELNELARENSTDTQYKRSKIK